MGSTWPHLEGGLARNSGARKESLEFRGEKGLVVQRELGNRSCPSPQARPPRECPAREEKGPGMQLS